MKDSKWKLIESYTVSTYRCGLRAGQKIALRRDLILTNSKGPTGKVHPEGEVYTVLHGSKDDPGVVWLSDGDGHRCTWDDGPEIYEWFELIDQTGAKEVKIPTS